MENMIKKFLFSLWVIGLLWAWTVWIVSATGSNTNTFWNPQWWFDGGQDWNHWLNVAASDNGYQNNKLVPTIKRFINWVLGMLSLIALVICLRGWFQMLTAAGDEGKYKKWFTILKQDAIALAVIGLSWLFVTLILYLINKSSEW